MVPSAATVTALVCGLARLGVAVALGRFTLMPCTVAVVMMMKITSNTYAKSSIGVMLMSLYGSLSTCAFMVHLRGGGVGLGQPADEFVYEYLHVGGDILDLGDDVVVSEQRRDRDQQAGHRRHQRGGDAGRDGVDVDVAAGGDRGEGDHHADHGAEQPEEGPAADGDAKQHQHLVELLVLAHEGGVETHAHALDRQRRERPEFGFRPAQAMPDFLNADVANP